MSGMTCLSIDLMAAEGRSAFGDRLASLICSERHGEADAILGRLFAAVPSPAPPESAARRLFGFGRRGR
jgi:hypothetical protein